MRLHLTLLSLAPLALAGCATPPPVTAPAPMQLASPLTPAAVVQAAVATLAAKGFTVTTSDATNGIMVAVRDIASGTAHDWLSCPWKPEAMGWDATRGTITVTVTARPQGSGSVVNIAGVSRTATALGSMRVDSDAKPMCVSGGQAEAAIAKAITTP